MYTRKFGSGLDVHTYRYKWTLVEKMYYIYLNNHFYTVHNFCSKRTVSPVQKLPKVVSLDWLLPLLGHQVPANSNIFFFTISFYMLEAF